MAQGDRSLRDTYQEAEQLRTNIETSSEHNSSTFQESLLVAVQLYEQCLHIADRISLFSPNETLEDIASGDLRYLLLHYRVAELYLSENGQERKSTLRKSQRSYETFLKQLDNYDLLSKEDLKLLEQFQDSPNTFSTANTNDAAARREVKIKRFKEQKALKQKLEYMRNSQSTFQGDETVQRDLELTNIAYCTHQTFASLESIGQELHILSLAPSSPTPEHRIQPQDARERNGAFADGFSERLDTPMNHQSAGLRGPLLDPQGKPLRPFTLTNARQEVQGGVFRPGHSLPTMSIDEYLEEERKRGGIIEGGGPESGMRPELNEDDMDAADRETMKAREWDEFVEANPKGSGNTINRG